MDNKTIFNYIGGKTWLKEYLRKEVLNQLTILSSINSTIDLNKYSYCEPFAGGLGAFLNISDILLKFNIKNIALNDINYKLINFYEVVNHQKEKLLNHYLSLELEYQKTLPQEILLKTLHRTKDQEKLKPLLKSSNEFYNKIRTLFNQLAQKLSHEKEDFINQIKTSQNELNIELASYLLFLQNHCFNGVYRENLKGEHNTPYNWESKSFDYKKTLEKIEAVHTLFNQFNIQFSSLNVEVLPFKPSCLYYLDPPYINDSIAENKYNQEAFSKTKQLSLIQKLKGLNFIYSNHYNSILIDEFKKENIAINIQTIARKNIISASKESRKEDKLELLISSQYT